MITSTKSSSNVLKLVEVVANGVLLFSGVNVKITSTKSLRSVLKLKEVVANGEVLFSAVNRKDHVDEVLEQCPPVERGRCQLRVALLRRQRE